MMIRSMRTAAVLSAAAMALSACNGGGGGGGPDPDRFFGQTWGAIGIRTDFAEFLDEGEGEKISITQHTGSMTLSEADIDAIVDFLFFGSEEPDILLGTETFTGTADGSDENPAHFELTDSEDNDFVFRIKSTGDLEMLILNEDDDFILAVTTDDEPDAGDDVAAVVATTPGVFGTFGELNYMSAVAWVTTAVPDDEATEVTVDFGLGHMGLVTPEGDIPITGQAFYEGTFVGVYFEPGGEGEEAFLGGGEDFIGLATGEAGFVANFVAMEVEGGVINIQIVGIDVTGGFDGTGEFEEFEDAGDIFFEDVTIIGSTFTGGVVPGEDGFADFDNTTGTVDGTFYGPVDDVLNGSAEAGAVLTLNDGDSAAFITGVIGATVSPEP